MATLRVRRRPWWKSSFKVASYADSYNWNKSGSYRYIWRKCRAFTAHQGNVWSLNPLDRDLSTSAHSWLLMLRKSYLTNFRDCRWPASNSLFCWVWLCEWYRWYYVAYMSTCLLVEWQHILLARWGSVPSSRPDTGIGFSVIRLLIFPGIIKTIILSI